MTLPPGLLAEPDAVVLDLDTRNGVEAVRALHGRLTDATNAVMDGPKFLADVLARMRLGPVCVADQVAMPHARTTAVDRPVMAIGRSTAGIPFDSDHPRIGLVFLIGVPKDAVTEYLKMVAVLTRWLRDRTRRAALFATPDEESFRALLIGGVLVRK